MANKQPEALRLAQHLEQFRSFPDDLAAAKELRSQHARIVELEEQLAPAQQASEPYAVLVFEIDEEGPFDRKPVKPGSVQHLHAKHDPHYDYVELYTHPTQQGLDAQDAARYRWLRNHGFQSAWAELGSDLDGAPFVCFVMRVHIPESISLPYEEQEWTSGDTDTAIDAAIAAQAKQGEHL